LLYLWTYFRRRSHHILIAVASLGIFAGLEEGAGIDEPQVSSPKAVNTCVLSHHGLTDRPIMPLGCRDRDRGRGRGEDVMEEEEDGGVSISTSKGVKVIKSFDDMGLRDDLLRGVYGYGYEKPSAIQQRALLPIIQGRDVIAQAQSGTGKSSLIAMAICQIVDTKQRE
jgi:hypothetical protein